VSHNSVSGNTEHRTTKKIKTLTLTCRKWKCIQSNVILF